MPALWLMWMWWLPWTFSIDVKRMQARATLHIVKDAPCTPRS